MWGGALSLPSLLFLGMFCNQLVYSKNKVEEVKIWLTIIGIVLTYAPFWILNGFTYTDNSSVSMFFWPYGATIVAGIWFYRLKGVGELKADNAMG
jgi:cbb3-type cytochrome oxidase subunit 1